MQRFKKSLVALLAVAMVMSLVGPALAAVPEDVAGTKYEDAAVRLMALGVFKGDDKGNFNPDAEITRAEAVAIVIRALGLEQSADLMSGVTKFADVNADPGLQWASGAINVAVSSGIINGYPDGNFGGRDNVTYEQLAKMILYALNYGVVVEGGVWPTAVLAKADDLEMLKGITVVPGVPIIRGLAAKMLDNSLDVPALKQYGYGDVQMYEETGDTLLSKMGYDEIEGRVVAVPQVLSALDDDEVVIEVAKVNGDELKEAKDETYAELETVDVQGLFGLKVRAWVNDDDEILFVQNKTADKDIYVDTVDEKADGKKVELVVLDDDVTFADDADVYVNYEKARLSDLDAGMYGRFVQDKNKVVFANVFEFKNNKGVVVSEVSGDKIRYFNTSKTKQTLDLTKADSVTVFNKDFTKASYDDIEEDTVLYFWNDDDDHYLVLVNDVVAGEVSKIENKKITVDGKKLTFNKEGTYSFDEDDTVESYDEKAPTIKDFDGEDVIALLNLKGHVRHLRGDAKATTGTQYGIVVDAPKYSQVTIFTKDGEEVTYDIAKRADYSWFDDYKFFGAKKASTDKQYAAVAYKLDSDGDIVQSDKAADAKVGLEWFTEVTGGGAIASKGNDQWDGYVAKKDGSTLVELYSAASGGGSPTNKFYASSSTVLMRALNSDGELDPEILDWDEFKKLNVEQKAASQAIIFGEDGKTAKLIVFVSEDFEGTGADIFYAVAMGDSYRKDGKWRIDLDVFGEGEETYVVADVDDVESGQAFAFKLNSKGQLVKTVDKTTVRKGVTANGAVDDGYIYDGSKWFKVDDEAVIYQLKKGKTSIDRAIDLGDLEDEDITGSIDFVVKDKDELVKAIVHSPSKEGVPDPGVATDGTVTYIDEAGKYVDFKDGSIIKVNNSTLESFLVTAANRAELEGLAVKFKTNNAKEAVALEVVSLGKNATVDETFFRNLLALGDITVAGEGTDKTVVTLTGDLDVDQDNVTITKLNIDADGHDITISGKNFTSKTNLLEGDVDVTGDNATFNTEIDGDVEVNAEGASFSNVKITGNLVANKDIVISGSTKVTGAITVAPGVVIDASKATDEDVKEAAQAAEQEKYFDYANGNTFIKGKLYEPSKPDRGLAAGFGFVFKEWTVNQLDSLKVTLLNDGEEVAIATLKDTSKWTGDKLSGAVYTIAKETDSWLMDRTVSGEIDDPIYNSYVLEVVKDGVNYTFTYPVD